VLDTLAAFHFSLDSLWIEQTILYAGFYWHVAITGGSEPFFRTLLVFCPIKTFSKSNPQPRP
jgi:hypothetical protein